MRVADQFTDTATGLYFQRIRCDYSEIVVGVANMAVLESAVSELASRFNMDWKVFYARSPSAWPCWSPRWTTASTTCSLGTSAVRLLKP